MRRASLPVPRSDATASVIGTRVWVVGGCKGDNICANASWGVACDCTVLTDNVAIFDTTTNSWSSAPNPMPRNRTRHAAHLVGGRRIYLVGGRNARAARTQGRTLLEVRHGQQVAQLARGLGRLPNLVGRRAVCGLAHNEAALQQLQRLKVAALALQRDRRSVQLLEHIHGADIDVRHSKTTREKPPPKARPKSSRVGSVFCRSLLRKG
jgi:hypothetical protein